MARYAKTFEVPHAPKKKKVKNRKPIKGSVARSLLEAFNEAANNPAERHVSRNLFSELEEIALRERSRAPRSCADEHREAMDKLSKR